MPVNFAQRTMASMLARLRFTLLLPLAASLACGSSSPSPGLAATAATGDYVLTVAPSTASAAQFVGNLNVSGSTASGVFQYRSPCLTTLVDIPFSGSISSSVLTLTSSSFSGSVATLTVQLPLLTYSDGQILANGTSQIAGGPCALAATTLQAAYVPSYDGNWNGTLSGPVTGSVSLSLAQSPADPDGQYPISGTVGFNASNCSFSTAVNVSGFVSGYNLQLAFSSNSNDTISASYSTTPVNFTMSLATASGGCPAGTYSGTLSH